MWTNGTRGAVKIAIQHEVLAKCCIVNRDHIPSTISSRTAVSSMLQLLYRFCVGGVTTRWRMKWIGDCHLCSKAIKQGKCSRFASPTKPDALTKAAEGIVPINTKRSTVAVFVVWLDMLEKCAIFITWLQKVMWLPQECYISHVTRKSVLYGECI